MFAVCKFRKIFHFVLIIHSIDAKAKYFAAFDDVDELEETLNSKHHNLNFILGGGSNILLTKDVDGLVLKNEIKGIKEIHEDSEYVYIKAGAGRTGTSLYCIALNVVGQGLRIYH